MQLLATKIIVQPIQKVAWVNPSCAGAYTWPAEVTEGVILIHITCKQTSYLNAVSQTITIDRYTGSYALDTQEFTMTLTGQCVSSQKQLF